MPSRDESFEGRTSLLERYRWAFERANGYAPKAVMYVRGMYEVHSKGNAFIRMRRKEFRDALNVLIERAEAKWQS